ncbi:MAG: (5-formylfuran-3-yl)methyl phosphate synthase [Candidatus Bathyarchaeota archaeon]
MKLLVSVVNRNEAMESVEGGAHIIDVKNPKEGSLGANFPRVIKEIKGIIPENIELSATIGDMPNLPGTAALAALGAAVSGVRYVKVGLFGVKSLQDSITLLAEVVQAVKEYDNRLKIIASGYADYKKIGCINPLKLPDIACKANADGVLIDVKIKDVKSNLFNFFKINQLKDFVISAHSRNLLVALAGSLRKQDIESVYNLGADIIGFRGALCTNTDRLNGKLEKEKVVEFVKEIHNITSN